VVSLVPDATIEIHEWTGVFPDLKLAYLRYMAFASNYYSTLVTIRNADRDLILVRDYDTRHRTFLFSEFEMSMQFLLN